MFGECNSRQTVPVKYLRRVLLLLLLLLVLFMQYGCFWEHPPPACLEYPGQYQSEAWVVPRMRMKPLGGAVGIDFTTCGRFHGMKSYELTIYLNVARTDEADLLVVNYDSVVVWFEGQKMFPRDGKGYPPDTLRNTEQFRTLKYEVRKPRLESISRSPSDMPGQGAIIRIAFDGFLYHNGVAVSLDTVKAIEPLAGFLWNTD
jgi:hypothetical protein